MNSAIQNKLYVSAGIIIVYLVLTWLPTPAGLTVVAQKALALMLCGVLAWVFEVLPLAVSAILFTVLAPALGIIPCLKQWLTLPLQLSFSYLRCFAFQLPFRTQV